MAALAAYSRWTPGLDIADGRHDRGRNGIWLQHGWLGDDGWFKRYQKEDRISFFRDPANIRGLAEQLRKHGIMDVFPHLCPASPGGAIPPVDPAQAELFLAEFAGFRVMPWVGGVQGVQAFPADPAWRRAFAGSIRSLLTAYPRFAGVHLNIEPCRSGNGAFLALLDEIREAMPAGKVLSVAAYPPPTLLHPFPDVHWDEAYYREVSKRADQLAVMMYDTALPLGKAYQRLVARWTREVLAWSGGAEVLLGLPAYDDAGVGYHDPGVENLGNALRGVHAGLEGPGQLPGRYQGVALYCEWEMDAGEWALFRERFCRPAR